MLDTNHTLSELRRGHSVVGAWLLSHSPRAAEVLSQTSTDWIGIDTEHAPYSPEHVETLIRAIEPNATPIVRLPSVEEAVSGAAKHALDSGAQGVIVPSVETVTDAEDIVESTHFPPIGKRGVAGTTRANAYGESFDHYVNNSNAETLVVIQIESPSAVESIEEILTVDGIDVAFIGENDLSSALGYPGKTDHPEVNTAVERVLDAAIEKDVFPGIAGRRSDIQAERMEQGFQFFLLGADLTFMRNGIEEFLPE
ncbi:HpcH/HpaI aldolase family protein [Natrialba taiwanensis]|uniref:2-dehydro-3-deoxyglucarate aldolase n=1 Tax=Natrialba taiwanensis DSM 12281 TaxID=1230458 RepID=L9ZIH6_9EURY|nr:aldolase/citrate lyase family protein [Natrialba taiwanensis]ELY86159.1 2-dehydro-3-deoxyglucarate aldolase [Natrialba taiwanensis DSM 12281]